MDKINFANLPSTTTPINATNLNQVQTNVDNAKVEKTTTISAPDDLNNYMTTGTWIAGGSISNIPVSGQVWYVEVIRYSATYVLQRATRYTSVLDNMTMFVRQSKSEGWTDWKDISAPIITSNANGTATKFPDGTMICRTILDKSIWSSTSSNSSIVQGLTIYRTSSYSWTFPEEFYDTNIVVQITPDVNGGDKTQFPIINSTPTKTKVNIQMVGLKPYYNSGSGYEELHAIHVTAIGRWK